MGYDVGVRVLELLSYREKVSRRQREALWEAGPADEGWSSARRACHDSGYAGASRGDSASVAANAKQLQMDF